jgi:hypothetical protein
MAESFLMIDGVRYDLVARKRLKKVEQENCLVMDGNMFVFKAKANATKAKTKVSKTKTKAKKAKAKVKKAAARGSLRTAEPMAAARGAATFDELAVQDLLLKAVQEARLRPDLKWSDIKDKKLGEDPENSPLSKEEYLDIVQGHFNRFLLAANSNANPLDDGFLWNSARTSEDTYELTASSLVLVVMP